VTEAAPPILFGLGCVQENVQRAIVLGDGEIRASVGIEVGCSHGDGIAGNDEATLVGRERREDSGTVTQQDHAQTAVHASRLPLRAEGNLRQAEIEVAAGVEVGQGSSAVAGSYCG
jgi:hypothetical protein